MKNKKMMIAGIALISTITILICSCRSTQEQATLNSLNSAESDYKEARSTSAEQSSVILDNPAALSSSSSSSSLSSSRSSSSFSSSSSSSFSSSSSSSFSSSHSSSFSRSSYSYERPKFDDPISYLEYDPKNDTYILSDEEKRLGEESLFVGDSICSGFSAWGVLKSKNVYAVGNVAARNLLDYDMYYQNSPAKLVPVLEEAKPRRVFFWMGMNDVNITSAEVYCKNYKKIIDLTLDNSDADVYVCAITPISNLKFTRLERIDEFNNAIKNYIMQNYQERVHYVTFAEPLKTADGLLSNEYNGGDGIHLGKKAYFIALHEINKQIKLENMQ